jgi:predicted enzyme related to lactoylglutathione lyase
MAERTDPFTALRRPFLPVAPRDEFAADLRRRLRQEMGMTQTDDQTPAEPALADHGHLAMVHLRVGDADRAMRFFGGLFGWEAERVLFDEHVSHYTVNTRTTVRILDDPASPPVVPNYGVRDARAAITAIEAAGGVVTESEPGPDGGGWARGHDDQGLPLLVFRPGRYHRAAPPTRTPTGEVGLVFLREDAQRAGRFYGTVLGWHLRQASDGHYHHAVDRVGVFDEAAAFGSEVAPSATLYLVVDALAPVLARVEELGGEAGPAAQDMGPYHSAVCHDDQGTEFGLMSETP